ncbi:tryptophan dimethylallyltransferase family protein [Asanoa iriomotensis]|uniref:Prenyltransferase n=1 Tax=Asanoa iriomotensis TaxID=234613 RepID=A0ABQ4CAI3_9ACTN|nr:tryptophan dimethylallyltransferase family protein [Asanoa iriomotensis]GIF59775.1 prenyltransferase [Asanoa iriomotensis]
MDQTTLFDRLAGQLHRLSILTRTDPTVAGRLLADLLGPAGARPLDRAPAWPSGIADDHTPVEFSLAFHAGTPPTLRILAEAPADVLTPAAHLAAGHAFVRAQADRLTLSLAAFDRVRHLFMPNDPRAAFTLWHSLVFARRPELKVYFNPEIRGTDRATELVQEGLGLLGLAASYPALVDRMRDRALAGVDRLAFFALDLHDGPHARVKLYLAHHDATADDMVHAAAAVKDVDPGELREFCRIAGDGVDVFAGLPLIGSYTFTAGATYPVGYSLYVPIRGYVTDDGEAYERVAAVLRRYRFDISYLDQALAAVTSRRLRDGVGLLAHVSLRLGPPRPGVTVYLSAEAYRVQPPGAAAMPTRIVEPSRSES